MASDFGPYGIRVNAIAPGEIDTAILSPGTDKLAEQLPMRRLGKTSEVAETIYFLCTEASSYVTGSKSTSMVASTSEPEPRARIEKLRALSIFNRFNSAWFNNISWNNDPLLR